jgi:hypothetical protein
VQNNVRGCPIPTPRRTGAIISADNPPFATTSTMSEVLIQMDDAKHRELRFMDRLCLGKWQMPQRKSG